MKPALLDEVSRVVHHDAITALHDGDADNGVHLLELSKRIAGDAAAAHYDEQRDGWEGGFFE